MSTELFAAFQEVLERYSVSIEHCLKRGDGEWLSRVVWSTRKPGQHGEIHKESPWEGYENTTDAIKAIVEAHKKPIKTQRAPKKSPLLKVFGPFMWNSKTRDWSLNQDFIPASTNAGRTLDQNIRILNRSDVVSVLETFKIRVRSISGDSHLECFANGDWRTVAITTKDKSFEITEKYALALSNCLLRLLAKKINYFKPEK